MVIKAIFLDFDGTVSDAKKLAYDSLIKTLEEKNFKFDKKKARLLLGSKMKFIFKDLGINSKHLEDSRKLFYKYFIQGAKDGNIKPRVSLKPLWKLSEELPLIVMSNSETSFLRASIKTLKLKGLFKKIYGAEKFSTKDKFLKQLFKEMKIKPSEAIYLGDRFSDIRYAKKTECVSVAIHNKCAWSTIEVIKKENPDYIVKNFRELRTLVKKLNK